LLQALATYLDSEVFTARVLRWPVGSGTLGA
jgi:hypothetical protein